MVEQLYIIKDGERFEVDLNNPCGITLNFKSNLFGDLSKISCSYSYTFKLPFTINNRRLFDNAEDIRGLSKMVRKRLRAEFYQNGILIFDDANLYIESVDNCYQANMTWGVIRGLQTLKDEDISLNELPDKLRYVMYSIDTQLVNEFSNTADFLKPIYDAGLRFTSDSELFGFWKNTYYPLPVVPVNRLIKAINEHFGTKFNVCSDYNATNYVNGSWITTRDDLIFTRGVVPLVNAEWTDEQKEQYATPSGSFGWGSNANYCGIGNILFISASMFGGGNFYSLKNNGAMQDASLFTTIEQAYNGGLKYEIDGYMTLKLDCPINEVPQFRVYQKKRYKDEAEVVASIDGEVDGNYYTFDFREMNGKDRLSFSYYPVDDGKYPDYKDGVFFFGFSHKPTDYKSGEFKFYIDVEPSKTGSTFLLDYRVASYPLATVRKLPDIGCLEFMKALFYMAGAFPVTKQDGSVGIVYYDEIKQAITKGLALDWSSKLYSSGETMPEKIAYTISGYAQRNYYLTKSDDLESDDKNKNEDKYASGIGIISVANECIEKDKTIITIPFNAPFIRSASSPTLPTGDTFKFWRKGSDGKVTCSTANPICGIIECRSYKDINGSSIDYMGMRCWNGFTEMEKNPSFAYLQKILDNPIVITETLNLNEFDLRDIDYSVPVYLNKYNSYFAIVTITRDSKGKCKCELIKLP